MQDKIKITICALLLFSIQGHTLCLKNRLELPVVQSSVRSIAQEQQKEFFVKSGSYQCQELGTTATHLVKVAYVQGKLSIITSEDSEIQVLPKGELDGVLDMDGTISFTSELIDKTIHVLINKTVDVTVDKVSSINFLMTTDSKYKFNCKLSE